MATLELCSKHNMVAYLEKTDGNTEFHQIMDFLTRSSIYYALTISPIVSISFVEQFWMTAKYRTINNISYIDATVASKPVTILEASIRSDLLFNDADGIDSLNNQAIFDNIQLMGFEGDLNTLTFNKALFSPKWKFLFDTMNHCISSKSTSWDQIPTNIVTVGNCLATNQKYNFSKLIFGGMIPHLDATKKFVMYPRFLKIFLSNQLKDVPVPLDHFLVLTLTIKVLTFMVKKGKNFSGKVTPLFDSMLVQQTEDESIPDSNPKGSGGNHGGQSSNDTSLSGNEDEIKDLKAQIKQLKKKARPVIKHHKAWIKSVSMKKRLARKKSMKKKLMQMESVSKQGRKTFKSVPTVHKDPAFDDLDDAMDYMETEDAHDEGTMKDSEETRVSTEDQVSTDKLKVSTDKPNKGTAEPKDGNSDESAAPTTVFRDDETIAQFLVTMSQNKTKQKGFEIKEIKDTDRPRTTTERSILTLKPLPKIDPKDKGKKVLEEKAESEGVNEAEKKFKMLANDEEIARKVQEEWEAEEEKKKLAEEEATMAAFTNEYDYIQARLNADKILAEKLQEEEREKFTIEQRAKFLHDTIAAQRRFLAQQSICGYQNKLPTRNQLRNQMMTYLKANENFIPVGSAKDEKLIEKKNKKAAGRRFKMNAQKRSKRQKTDFDHEEENHLRTCLKIVPEEEKIDYEVLGTSSCPETEDGTKINMLAERRYPLTKNTLERMMDLRLTVVSDDDTVFDLLRFIEQQIDEFRGQDGSEKDL
ncbi:hypothetical protein Tco_1283270 [Tanacetum coccineum]